MRKAKSLSAFSHRNFLILYPASLISNIGTWGQRIAQDWLVLQVTHSAVDLGWVTALQFLPTLVFSLYGGVLADRFSKRKLLMLTNGGGGFTALILGLLVTTNTVQGWHIYVLALLLGIFSAVDAPVRQSFVSELVGKEDLSNAVSLNAANFNIGRLVGPSMAGLMIAAYGTGPTFLLNAFSFGLMVLTLLFLREDRLIHHPKPAGRTTLKDAIQYVQAHKDIKYLMITLFFAATFGVNFQIFNAVMATKEFHLGAAQFGGLGSALAIGALLAAVASVQLQKYRTPRRIMAVAAVFGLVLIAMALMPNIISYSLVLPFTGFASLTGFISTNAWVQTHTEPHLRGRVMGLYLMILMGGTPIGAPVIGYLASWIGIRPTIVACGAITAAAAIFLFLKFGRRNYVASELV